MEDKTKVKVNLKVKCNNTEIQDSVEVPNKQLEGLDVEKVKEFIDDYVYDWMINQIDVEWEVIETPTNKHSMKVRELIKLLMEEDMDKEVRVYAPFNPNPSNIIGFVSANDREENAPVTLII